MDKTLGANSRLVYLHGAWVWTGMVTFAASGLAGLVGLALRRPRLHAWSNALARSGMTFWLTYLPMSMLVMQLNWGGLFWDEPRWRVPLTFAIVGLLLQMGLGLVNIPALASAANAGFAAALWVALGSITNILHPDSPIFNSNSRSIQLFFSALLLLTLVLSASVTVWWRSRQPQPPT